MTAEWAAALAGVGATLVAAIGLLVVVLRGWRKQLAELGRKTGKRIGKIAAQLSSLELASARREAKADAREEHVATHGYVAIEIQKALEKHAESCRARELEHDSHVDAESPFRRPGGG